MKRTGYGMIVVGTLILFVSLGAELIGLSDDPGFQVGAQQASGIALGLVVVLVGVAIIVRQRSSR